MKRKNRKYSGGAMKTDARREKEKESRIEKKGICDCVRDEENPNEQMKSKLPWAAKIDMRVGVNVYLPLLLLHMCVMCWIIYFDCSYCSLVTLLRLCIFFKIKNEKNTHSELSALLRTQQTIFRWFFFSLLVGCWCCCCCVFHFCFNAVHLTNGQTKNWIWLNLWGRLTKQNTWSNRWKCIHFNKFDNQPFFCTLKKKLLNSRHKKEEKKTE